MAFEQNKTFTTSNNKTCACSSSRYTELIMTRHSTTQHNAMQHNAMQCNFEANKHWMNELNDNLMLFYDENQIVVNSKRKIDSTIYNFEKN